MENWALAAVCDRCGGSTLRILVSACSAAWARGGCPAYADDDGFQLALAEHQRRQLAVVAVQLVADACFAANVCALRAQGVDVAVERARADAQLGGKLGGGGGAFAAVAQDVEQLEQAGGFGHGSFKLNGMDKTGG